MGYLAISLFPLCYARRILLVLVSFSQDTTAPNDSAHFFTGFRVLSGKGFLSLPSLLVCLVHQIQVHSADLLHRDQAEQRCFESALRRIHWAVSDSFDLRLDVSDV